MLFTRQSLLCLCSRQKTLSLFLVPSDYRARSKELIEREYPDLPIKAEVLEASLYGKF